MCQATGYLLTTRLGTIPPTLKEEVICGTLADLALYAADKGTEKGYPHNVRFGDMYLPFWS